MKALDPLNTYRGCVLRAWTILASGRPAAHALPALRGAEECSVSDPAFHGMFVTTYGQIRHQTGTRAEPLWGFDAIRDTDRAALATTADGLHALSWRGSVFAITGATSQAIDDLTLLTNRMNDGAVELSEGVLHAFLAFAQWCSGEWQRAAITFDVTSRVTRGTPHPTVLAVAPLTAVVTGDDPTESLVRSREARLTGPIPAAIYVGDIVEVAVLAFTGTPDTRADWRASRTAAFGEPSPHVDVRPSLLWLLAHGIGAAWAGDAEATDAWADTLAKLRGEAWQPNAVTWLRALAHRTRRQPTHLGKIADHGLPGLASFAALLAIDAAQDTHSTVDTERGETAITRLGGGRYIPKLLPRSTAVEDHLAALSNREREVASLLLEGLSYSQIAKELYVTRSTVAFHLSNTYAKTGTHSRHELVQLLRR